jgi:molybdopterin/thiamine biosynthesis adenylyltransferase
MSALAATPVTPVTPQQKRYEDALLRQWDILPFEALERYPITIIGAGAIGGWLALSLAKMGCRDLTIFDADSIEIENIGMQFYRYADIGRKKVEALSDLIYDFTEFRPRVIAERYMGEVPFKGIVVSAVDSMDVRKIIWEAHRSRHDTLLIDPRMGAETALLYAFRCSDDPNYDATLYLDKDAVQERCTAKATIYTANLLAGYACSVIKAMLMGHPYPPSTQWDIARFHKIAFMPPQEKAPA